MENWSHATLDQATLEEKNEEYWKGLYGPRWDSRRSYNFCAMMFNQSRKCVNIPEWQLGKYGDFDSGFRPAQESRRRTSQKISFWDLFSGYIMVKMDFAHPHVQDPFERVSN